METGMISWKSAEDCPHGTSQTCLTCVECGRTFLKPILARVSTSGKVQTYQACPHCMTRVYNIADSKSEKRKPAGLQKVSNASEDLWSCRVECGHFYGYLNKRQKGTAIPEQCLICAKVVDCLYG